MRGRNGPRQFADGRYLIFPGHIQAKSLDQEPRTHYAILTTDIGDFRGGTPVVIKQSNPRTGGQARLQTEALTLELLDGRNAPRLVENATTCDDPTQAWFAQQFVALPTLGNLVHPTSGPFAPLQPDQVIIFARRLWEAIRSIHGFTLAHRDLAASNVLVEPHSFAVTIIDFGSSYIEGTGSITLGGEHQVPGTPGFAAPELFFGRGESEHPHAGPAADVWGWAAVVTMAASGQPPYTTTSRDYLRQMFEQEPPDLNRVPPELLESVRLALDFVEDRRLSAIADIEDALPAEPLVHAKRSLSEARQQLAQHQADAERARHEHERLASDLARLDSELKDARALQAGNDQLTDRLAELSAELNTARAAHTRLKARRDKQTETLKQHKQVAADAERELASLRTVVAQLQSRIETEAAQALKLREALVLQADGLRSERDELSGRLAHAHDQLNALRTDLESAQAERNSALDQANAATREVRAKETALASARVPAAAAPIGTKAPPPPPVAPSEQQQGQAKTAIVLVLAILFAMGALAIGVFVMSERSPASGDSVAPIGRVGAPTPFEIRGVDTEELDGRWLVALEVSVTTTSFQPDFSTEGGHLQLIVALPPQTDRDAAALAAAGARRQIVVVSADGTVRLADADSGDAGKEVWAVPLSNNAESIAWSGMAGVNGSFGGVDAAGDTATFVVPFDPVTANSLSLAYVDAGEVHLNTPVSLDEIDPTRPYTDWSYPDDANVDDLSGFDDGSCFDIWPGATTIPDRVSPSDCEDAPWTVAGNGSDSCAAPAHGFQLVPTFSAQVDRCIGYNVDRALRAVTAAAPVHLTSERPTVYSDSTGIAGQSIIAVELAVDNAGPDINVAAATGSLRLLVRTEPAEYTRGASVLSSNFDVVSVPTDHQDLSEMPTSMTVYALPADENGWFHPEAPFAANWNASIVPQNSTFGGPDSTGDTAVFTMPTPLRTADDVLGVGVLSFDGTLAGYLPLTVDEDWSTTSGIRPEYWDLPAAGTTQIASVHDLEVGSCVAAPYPVKPGSINAVAVSCDQVSTTNEILTISLHTDVDFATEPDDWLSVADQICGQNWRLIWRPSTETWADGGRTVTCASYR